ncbi:MAG: hypothetical protein J2P58_02785 [Acidimicrobiaceae bacterium]|nr:hypothetical protein [Acidimicrobiaceae bacterium]
MPVLASPVVIEQILDDLRTKSAQLQDVRAEISARANALHWEGGGVDRFHTQLDHAERGFNHCVDVFEQVFRLLSQAVTEQTGARNAAVRYEDYVMNQAQHAKDPRAFLAHLGWTGVGLPAPYSTEWEDLAIRAGYRP